jgi:hypothetical protein
VLKAVAIVAGNSRLMEIQATVDEAEATFNERLKFLEKQANDVREGQKAAVRKMNADLTEYFRETGGLPEGFDPKLHHFVFEKGAVMICQECRKSRSLADFLRFLEDAND